MIEENYFLLSSFSVVLFRLFSKSKRQSHETLFFLLSIRVKYSFVFTSRKKWSVSESRKSVLGRSLRMRPIASNYSEKLKHDSFVLLYFFVCFYFVLYFNTCVNIFVLLKAPGEEAPSCTISLNSTEQQNKNYTEISLFNFVFACFKTHCTGDLPSTHVPCSLKFVSEHQTQRSYMKLGCMCRCIICKYGNPTFSYSHFFCSITTHRHAYHTSLNRQRHKSL